MLVRNREPLIPTNSLGTNPRVRTSFLPPAIINFVTSPDLRGQTKRECLLLWRRRAISHAFHVSQRQFSFSFRVALDPSRNNPRLSDEPR